MAARASFVLQQQTAAAVVAFEYRGTISEEGES
jgi:hypothetical protein